MLLNFCLIDAWLPLLQNKVAQLNESPDAVVAEETEDLFVRASTDYFCTFNFFLHVDRPLFQFRVVFELFGNEDIDVNINESALKADLLCNQRVEDFFDVSFPPTCGKNMEFSCSPECKVL